ncbi:hypothetical protein ACVXHB_22260 [Escherichia coli]
MIKYFTLNAVSKSASRVQHRQAAVADHHYINALPPEYVATHLQWHIEQENIDTRNGPQLADLVKPGRTLQDAERDGTELPLFLRRFC